MQCSEPVATDTIQLDTPAIDGGETYVQIFIGTCSLIMDVYGMKSPAQFPGTLSDNIMQHGAPTKLLVTVPRWRSASTYRRFCMAERATLPQLSDSTRM